jgi:hypothetical protein
MAHFRPVEGCGRLKLIRAHREESNRRLVFYRLSKTSYAMFFHVESQAVAITVITILVGLDVLAVIGRLYTRRSLQQAMRPDDWLIIPALVSIQL